MNYTEFMMISQWTDKGAEDALSQWGTDHGEDLALRVYTSRLIGADPELVLHGGGNTSVKTKVRNIFEEEIEVIFVKGSGSSLDSVTPKDLPGLDLSRLRRLRNLESLTDEEMVNQLRTRLLDASSPNPSVETLLHAFLPHSFVDHSHANAILALTDQPNGVELASEALGGSIGILPYVMPGFPLAQAVAEVVETSPDLSGVVLAKHGLFSFGASAKESYERHIHLVNLAEEFLSKRRNGKTIFTFARTPFKEEAKSNAAMAFPILRGLLAEKSFNEEGFKKVVGHWDNSVKTLEFCASREAETLVKSGPITPDHVIRTKKLPLFIDNPAWSDVETLRNQLSEAVHSYRNSYDAYFRKGQQNTAVIKDKLSSSPKVVLLNGAGALCFGPSYKEANIVADITQHTLATKALAQVIGQYESITDGELFEMEYWSLEQAKLKGTRTLPLSGQVALITGGAGAIARGIAIECAKAGAQVALCDTNKKGASQTAAEINHQMKGNYAKAIEMNVTNDESVREAFDETSRSFGGVDIVVPNAGIAYVERIEELSSKEARKVSEVNYIGVLNTIREAARIFRLQMTGGNVVLNASKNVFSPGKEFGAYSASKAAASQIAKVSAIELASLSVRVNLINADAIFSSGSVPSGLWDEVGPERARRRGISLGELPDFYKERNLLKTQVDAHHVGRAVVFFASNLTPTTGATLPVDGGIPEAFPR